jgi:hypothetical protein
MNPRKNPFAPGAGTKPPELAGRDKIIETVAISLDRIRDGLSAKSVLMVGLRGVGKTVLLNQLRQNAEAANIMCAQFEAQEKGHLAELLIPALRTVLLHLDRKANAKEFVAKAMRVVGSFIKGAKFKHGELEFAFDLGAELGVADSGDFDYDLQEMLAEIGKVAKEAKTAVVLFIDELQYVPESQLGGLITALHHCAQNNLPIALVGAGLPQLIGKTGKAKSYAERLFEFPPIGQLSKEEATDALQKPLESQSVQFTPEAIGHIYEQTHGYPYFLQEWGSHCWAVAEQSPITAQDVNAATALAITQLDASFFRVRYDRCTPMEKNYMRAMAELDTETPRSGEIAEVLGREINTLGPLRQSLIAKGMIYSPAHGDTAFTVPLFAEYMRRTTPLSAPSPKN